MEQAWLEDDEIPYKKQWIEDYIKQIKELKQENAKLKEMIENGKREEIPNTKYTQKGKEIDSVLEYLWSLEDELE